MRTLRFLIRRTLAGCALCAASALTPALAQAADAAAPAPDRELRWQRAIAAFAAEDARQAPPPGGVLFVGSSSIRLWGDLEQQFAAQPIIIKRGFGGSRLYDCVRLRERLVIHYKPRLVLVYAGDNDLAEGRSPAQVLQSFAAFAEGVQRALPATRVAFISIKPSPARAALIERVREANTLVRNYTAARPQLDYIDVFDAMLDRDGRPRPELFRADRLHLNGAGYALWQALIRPHLR